MRNKNRDEVIVIKDACKDVTDLLAAGWLPRYILQLGHWQKEEAHGRWGFKLDRRLKKPLEAFIFFTTLSAIALMINGNKMPALASYHYMWICGAYAIAALMAVFAADHWDVFGDPREYGLWIAIKWLFDLVPMKADGFPRYKEELGMFYADLMADLARLVGEFEDTDQKRIAAIAKMHLEIIFDDAQSFGFIRDPRKGLGPSFTSAAQATNYRVLNVERWIAKYAI